jgi:beta-aspartyl-peptidase (threonine type)
MLNKQYGRIGDSPIIGAGNYANDNTCAISCTGHGEFFIRYAASFDVHCLMEYKGLSLEEAVRTVIFDKLKPANAEGGMIAVDGKGNITLQFNALGMHRAYRTSDNHEYIALYGDE